MTAPERSYAPDGRVDSSASLLRAPDVPFCAGQCVLEPGFSSVCYALSLARTYGTRPIGHLLGPDVNQLPITRIRLALAGEGPHSATGAGVRRLPPRAAVGRLPSSQYRRPHEHKCCRGPVGDPGASRLHNRPPVIAPKAIPAWKPLDNQPKASVWRSGGACDAVSEYSAPNVGAMARPPRNSMTARSQIDGDRAGIAVPAARRP